jgi:hypothetical protein
VIADPDRKNVFFFVLWCWVARFFVVQDNKTGKVPKMTKNIPNGDEVDQTAVKYIDQMAL